MNRRAFVGLLGSAAAGWPLAGRAQQPAMPVIGFCTRSLPGPTQLARMPPPERNWLCDGRNVAIEFRWAEGNFDRLPDLAADLVRRRMSVIAAPSKPTAAPPRPLISHPPFIN
jgi:putative ABC transport system substrate-binding protein